MKRILLKTERKRDAVLLCVLTAILAVFWGWLGNSPVRAEQIESYSHASSALPCPKCGESLTVVSVKDTTCTTRGYIEYNCDECNQYHEIVYEELAAHKWMQVSSSAATCTQPVYITNKCRECGTTVTEEVKDSALGHNYREDVIAPTCSSIGYTLHTCTRCGDSFHTDQTETTEHTYSQTVTVEPTCQSVGQSRNICLVCNYHFTEEIPMVEHDWKTEAVGATHSTNGYTVYTCQFCETVMRGDFTELLPYDMVWEEHPASCTASGLKVGYCADGCGHTETVMIPHLGHTFGEWMVLRAASEESDGLESRVCTRCDHTENRTVKHDPNALQAGEPMKPMTLLIIVFLLLVGIVVVGFLFLLLLEHARRDKNARPKRSFSK